MTQAPFVDSLEARVKKNVFRASILAGLYRGHTGATGRQGRKHPESGDLLRAAVVFLHATLEDFLRSIEHQGLLDAGSDVLEKIPREPAKMTLEELRKHRGKTIEKVMEEFLEDELSKRSYPDTNKIASSLRACGIDIAPVRSTFADLDALIRRRHDIVHRADMSTKTGRGHHQLQSISSRRVSKWATSLGRFFDEVLRQLRQPPARPKP